jgi:hypothetical protein
MYVKTLAKLSTLATFLTLCGCVSVESLMYRPPIFESYNKNNSRELALCISNSEVGKRKDISMLPVKNGYGFLISQPANASSAIVLTDRRDGSLVRIYAQSIGQSGKQLIETIENCRNQD